MKNAERHHGVCWSTLAQSAEALLLRVFCDWIDMCILVIGRTVKFRFSSVAFAGTSLAQMFRSILFLPVINAYFWNYRLNLVDDNSAA
jgi:hypothetical protein